MGTKKKFSAGSRMIRIEASDNISRKTPVVLCLVAVLLCLVYAYARPSLTGWWRQAGGGVPYVLFWISLWFVALPNRKFILPICVGVALFTCLLEFLQLWNPQPLSAIRATKLGAAWLGSQFAWADIPPYFIGAAVGFLMLRLLFIKRSGK